MSKNNDIINMINNNLNDKHKILLIEYLFKDLKSSDYPNCLHCIPLLPILPNNEMRLFWKNDQMEQDIFQQIFGKKQNEFIYFSNDKLCVDILSNINQNDNNLCIINIDILSKSIITILNDNKCNNPNTNIFNLNNNNDKFCQLLALLFNYYIIKT